MKDWYKKIFLIAIPYGQIYGKIRISAMEYGPPPLGLIYIASLLRSKGKQIELIDMQHYEEGWDALFSKIKCERPKIAGFTSVTPQILSVVQLAKIIKKIDPNIKVAVGGSHPSALPEETLAYKGIDIVVAGEGEYTMLELSNDIGFNHIKGICYRNSSGEIILNQRRALIEDLDVLPEPAYDLLPVHKYGFFGMGKCMTVISGRGCPYNCTFCSSKVVFENRYRVNSPGYFVNILEKLKCDFNIKKFAFCDDTFTSNPDRVMEICNRIIKRNLKINWTCITRVSHLNKNIVRILKRSGCQRIAIGIESGDQEVLNKAQKGITLKQIEEAVDLISKAGIEVHGFFILGLPFETIQSMQRTINFAKRLKLDYAQIAMYVPLPGSKGWDIVKEGKILKCYAKDWHDFCRYSEAIVGSEQVPRETLTYYYRKALREFYLRPYMLWKTLKKCTSLEKIKILAKMAMAFLKAIGSP